LSLILPPANAATARGPTSTLDEAVASVAYVNSWEVVYGCEAETHTSYNIVNGTCAKRQPRQSNILPQAAGCIVYIAALLARWGTALTVLSK